MSQQEERDATNHGLRPIGTLISPSLLGQRVPSHPTASTGNGSSTSSEIMPPPMTGSNSTGRALSEIGSGALSNVLAESFKAGDPKATDDQVEELLPPSVRSALRSKRGSETVDWAIVGYSLSGPISLDDALTALALVRPICAQAPGQFIAGELMKCLLVTKGKAEEGDDLKGIAAVMIDDLSEFPADIVRDALRYWRRTEIWRPSSAELRALCTRRFARRNSLRVQLERAAMLQSDHG